MGKRRRNKAEVTETFEEIVENHEEELEKETKKEERKMKAKTVLKKIGIIGGIAGAAAIGGYLFGNRKQYSDSDAEADFEDDREYTEINPEPTPDAD